MNKSRDQMRRMQRQMHDGGRTGESGMNGVVWGIDIGMMRNA